MQNVLQQLKSFYLIYQFFEQILYQLYFLKIVDSMQCMQDKILQLNLWQ